MSWTSSTCFTQWTVTTSVVGLAVGGEALEEEEDGSLPVVVAVVVVTVMVVGLVAVMV